MQQHHTMHAASAALAVLLCSGTISAQSNDLRLLNFDGVDAPGLTNAYRMTGEYDALSLATVLEDGSMVFTYGVSNGNVSRLGLFRTRPGQSPLAIAHGNFSPVGNNYDTAETEFGTENISLVTEVFAASGNGLFYSLPNLLRVDDNGVARFYAEMQNRRPTPDTLDTQVVMLESDGSDDPVMVERFYRRQFNAGDPVGPWHSLSLSPDGARGAFSFRNEGGPTDWEVGSTENGTIVEVTARAGDAIPNGGTPAAVNLPAPAEWSNWVMSNPRLAIAGNSGVIGWLAFCVDVIDDGSGNPSFELIGSSFFIGLPGAGHTPLFDPRSVMDGFPDIASAGAPGEFFGWSLPAMITDDDRAVMTFSFVDSITQEIVFAGLWGIDSARTAIPIFQQGDQIPGLEPGETATLGGYDSELASGELLVVFDIETGSGASVKAYYTMSSSGEFTPHARIGDTVEVEGRAGGPFTLSRVDTVRPVFLFGPNNERIAFHGRVVDAGGSEHLGIIYTNASGGLSAVPTFERDPFPTDSPVRPSGTINVSSMNLRDVNSSGRAAVVARVIGDSVLATVDFDAPACPGDTNGDGLLTPADFNAWVIAFNNQDPACDQNGDDQCTPTDFNAWIINFNAGC